MLPVQSLEMYESDKIISLDSAIKIIKEIKKTGKKIGLCHGGFDLTHPGHVKHFEMAKKLCDVLFVSVTSDEFVTSRKGAGRPIYTDKLRAYMIASIQFVDYVVITPFKSGVDVIKQLKPSFYIKGSDFINKKTPGIESERAAIKAVGGEMKYTTEPPMSTTKIIDYIKNEVDKKRMLLVIDRDGTIIRNNDFLGKNADWEKEIVFNDDVVNFISYLKTKYQPTKIVVTNQTGVARRFFTCETVEKINRHVDKELIRRGVKIDAWEYCPFADKAYAKNNPQHNIDPKYVQEKTKRKPSTDMVTDALKKLGKEIKDFEEIVVIGDRQEDKELADNLNARFVDVNDKTYKELINSFN